MNKRILAAVLALSAVAYTQADTFQYIKFGDMNNWLTRNIKESRMLGGKTKQVYEVTTAGVDNTGKAYSNRNGSPWGTSNVLASPAGITKTSNAVYPDDHAGHGKCAKLKCEYETCKVLGMVNIEVVVGGSLFTGQMIEPIKSTSNPYSKMNMGMAFTKRPKALRFDYKVLIPSDHTITYSSGFGKKKSYAGIDRPEALIFLQRRWEDANGNLFAKRVGTARETFGKTTSGWVNAHDMKIVYGDPKGKVSNPATYALIPEAKSYYAYNSKGKLVPVKEVGYDDPNATPTHAIVMFSACSGEPYTGTLGTTFWVDNIGMVY